MLGLVPNSEDYWLFGSSFLRGYYSVFDMETGQLGLAPHVDSDKNKLAPGTVPLNYLTGGTSLLSMSTTAIVGFILVWLFIEYIQPKIDEWVTESTYRNKMHPMLKITRTDQK